MSDDEIGTAMRFARDKLGLTLEPGGAAGLAALLCEKVEPVGRTLVILSGGNVFQKNWAQRLNIGYQGVYIPKVIGVAAR